MSLGTIRLSLTLALVIPLMPLALLAAGCGTEPGRSEPTTAKEKQQLEQTTKDEPTNAGQLSGWRYAGDRSDCFFVVGRNCYKTQEAACAAAKCGAAKCEATGGGPAAVACTK